MFFWADAKTPGIDAEVRDLTTERVELAGANVCGRPSARPRRLACRCCQSSRRPWGESVKTLFQGATMAAQPKRRRFRFSLRTMFVAFTVVAIWLGWNLHKVQQRNAALGSIAGKHRILQLPEYLAAWDVPKDREKAARYTQEVEADRAIFGRYMSHVARWRHTASLCCVNGWAIGPFGLSRTRRGWTLIR